MKKRIKNVLLCTLFTVFAMLLAGSASAADISDVTFAPASTGKATVGSADDALNYVWFTLSNNASDAVTLTLGPTGRVYSVDSNARGGLSALAGDRITIAGGTTATVAVSSPQLSSVMLTALDEAGGTRMLAGVSS